MYPRLALLSSSLFLFCTSVEAAPAWYTYDDVGRLVDVFDGRVALSYTYDPAGNLTTRTIICEGDCFIGGSCYSSGEADPGDACAACDPATSAADWTPRAPGSTCDDNDACTTDDACQNGTCAGTPVDCSGECVTPNSCDPQTGACAPRQNGTACTGGTCVEGTCQTAGLDGGSVVDSGTDETTPEDEDEGCGCNATQRERSALWLLPLIGLFFFRRPKILLLLLALSWSSNAYAISLRTFFEANQGQADARAKFLARGSQHTLFFTEEGLVITWGAKEKQASLRMVVKGANEQPKVTGLSRLTGKHNYFLGQDPKKWHTNVPLYGRVKYQAVYPGIDLLYRDGDHNLEFDFIVSPGADPKRIQLAFHGAERAHLDEEGNLCLQTANGEVKLDAPVLFQQRHEKKVPVEGRFQIVRSKAPVEVRFAVGPYDKKRTLVIDPVLIYSSFLGGRYEDYVRALTVDDLGYIYLTGSTIFPGLPTKDAYQPTHAGPVSSNDAFITKLSPDGSVMIFSTFLGGGSPGPGGGWDGGNAIGVDRYSNVYFAGETASDDFPVTTGAAQTVDPGGYCSGFVSSLTADGSQLIYSTYFGGAGRDEMGGMDVDLDGTVWLAGTTSSPDFPVTVGAYQGAINNGHNNTEGDAFIASLDDAGSVLFSTYIGGAGNEVGADVASDGVSGYMTGLTRSRDDPKTKSEWEGFYGVGHAPVAEITSWNNDVFVLQFAKSGQVTAVKLWGGNDNDEPFAIDVDGFGNAYVTGTTYSPDIPLANPILAISTGLPDIFVFKTNFYGFIFSTYLGGSSGFERGEAIHVTAEGLVTVAGKTEATDFFPLANAYQTEHLGVAGDAFVVQMDTSGVPVYFGTYLGGTRDDGAKGVALDEEGRIIVGGYTGSGNFPTLNPVDDEYRGVTEGFVSIFGWSVADTSSDFVYSGREGDPVNTLTGEFFIPETVDLDLGGPMPLRFTRYHATGLHKRPLRVERSGLNWRHNYDWWLESDGTTVSITSPQGVVIAFTNDGTGWSLVGNKPSRYQLAETAAEYILYDPIDERTYAFGTHGKLDRIEDRHGNTHTLNYSGTSLNSVEDGLGREITFTIDFSNFMLGEVADGTGERKITFSHVDNRITSMTHGVQEPRTRLFTQFTGAQAGLLTSVTMPAGNTPYSQTYDSRGRVGMQTDAYGNETTFTYGRGPTANSTTTISGPLGHTVMHVHNADGVMIERNENGRAVTRTSDAFGRVTAIRGIDPPIDITFDPVSGRRSAISFGGNTVTSTYATRTVNGIDYYDLTGITHPDGLSDTFGYDADGKLIAVTDRAGNTATFTRNAANQVLISTDPSGGTMTYSYNADATQASATDHAGNITTFGYDAQLRRNLITHPDTTTRSFRYNEQDQVVAMQNEEGHNVYLSYDLNGNLAAVCNARGSTTTFDYDDMDRFLVSTDPHGATSSVTYDAAGRYASQTDRNGNTSRFDYTDGLLTGTTDPEGFTWQRSYDNQGRLTSSTDPLSHSRTYSYDAMGRLQSVANPSGARVQFGYDVMGRRTSVLHAIGSTTSYSYDALGFLTSIASPGGITVGIERNALGQITKVTDPARAEWLYSYDTQGRSISETDPDGNETQYSYDDRNRINLATLPDSMGTIDVSYDGLGLETERTYSDGLHVFFQYSPDGRLTQSDGLELVRDANNNIVTSNGITIGRDSGGRIERIELAPGKTIDYAYDGRDLVTSISDWSGALVAFGYDEAGRLTTITRDNGVVSTYAYDEDSQLVGILEEMNTELMRIALTRDAIGNVVAAERDMPSSQSGTYELTTTQVSAFAFDPLGRQTTDGNRAYTWDLASRLTNFTEGGNTVSYTYDGLDYVISRTEGGATDEYVWNYALELPSIAVVRRNGTDATYYVYTPDGELVYSIDATAEERRYYHYDERGSTILLTDATGAVTDTYAYAPYGYLTNATGTSENPFLFSGKYGVMQESQSGLYRMRRRVYDAVSTRFLSRDPIREVGPASVNPYQYAMGNPLRYVDPTGETGDDTNKGKKQKNETVEATKQGLSVGKTGVLVLDTAAREVAEKSQGIVDAARGTKNLNQVWGGKKGQWVDSAIAHGDRLDGVRGRLQGAGELLGDVDTVIKVAEGNGLEVVGDEVIKRTLGNTVLKLKGIGTEGVKTYKRVEKVHGDMESDFQSNYRLNSGLQSQLMRHYQAGLLSKEEWEKRSKDLTSNYEAMNGGASQNGVAGILQESLVGLVKMSGF